MPFDLHIDKNTGALTFPASHEAMNYVLNLKDEAQIANLALAGYEEKDMLPISGPDDFGALLEELAGASPDEVIGAAARLVLPNPMQRGGRLDGQQIRVLSALRSVGQRVEAAKATMEAHASMQPNAIVGFNSAALAASFGTCSVTIQPGTGPGTGGWVFIGLLFDDAVVQRVGVKNFYFAGMPVNTGTATVTPAPATTGVASLSMFDTRNPGNQLLPYIGREFNKDDTITFDLYNHTVATDVNGGAISVCGVVQCQIAPCDRVPNPVGSIQARRAQSRTFRAARGLRG